MEKNPYFNDWLRSIESMNEEELIKVIEEGNRADEFIVMARERLAFIRSDNSPKELWEEKTESAIKDFQNKEFKKKINNMVDDSAENTLSFFAIITLIVGVVAGLALAALAADAHKPESYLFVFAALCAFLSSLMTWASIKVFVNISKTLKEINYRLSQKK